MGCIQRPVQQDAGVKCVACMHPHPPSARAMNSDTTSSVQSGDRLTLANCLPVNTVCTYIFFWQITRQQYGAAALSVSLLFQTQIVVDGPQMTVADSTWMRGSLTPEASAAYDVLQVHLCLQTSGPWVPFKHTKVHQHVQTGDLRKPEGR